jgi:hypothetical protein
MPKAEVMEGEEMTDTATDDEHGAGWYEIRLKGHLESRWVAWFDGMSLTTERGGTTLIHGPVVDQAALHGLLRRVRDVGLPLVSITQVEPHPRA